MGALFAALLAAIFAVIPIALCAQTGGASKQPPLVTLHAFCSSGYSDCADGSNPDSPLSFGADGTLYGTTFLGGGNDLVGPSYGPGTAFRLTPTKSGYVQQVIYSFCSKGGTLCTDGFAPSGPLTADKDGNLYGVATEGGEHGGGTAFMLSPVKGKTGYAATVLYSFCGTGGSNCTDGKTPYYGVTLDTKGHLYGIASAGGAHGKGAVFELSPTSAKGVYRPNVLYSFCSEGGSTCSDGESPYAPLLRDAAGDLYVTTTDSASTGGTLVELVAKSGGKYQPKVLYQFCRLKACADGARPNGVLSIDGEKNIFGTTMIGGTHADGTVYELPYDKARASYAAAVKVLYDFCRVGGTGCTDGATPYGGVIKVGGNLYGTAFAGGAHGFGVVFALSATKANGYRILHSFCETTTRYGCLDGNDPEYGVVADAKGNLYGTTTVGGPDGTYEWGGTVFKLTP